MRQAPPATARTGPIGADDPGGINAVRRISSVVRDNATSSSRRATVAAVQSLADGLGAGLGGHTFRRGCAIGGCPVDLVCIEAGLVIQIDGGGQGAYDARRTVMLAESGFRVLRFWSDEVQQRRDAIVAEIAALLPASGVPENCATALRSAGGLDPR